MARYCDDFYSSSRRTAKPTAAQNERNDNTRGSVETTKIGSNVVNEIRFSAPKRNERGAKNGFRFYRSLNQIRDFSVSFLPPAPKA